MLEGTTTFVTGASQGLGREIAITFAEKGANVALAARGDGIYETQDQIGSKDQTLAVRTDLTDEDSVISSIDETVAEFGGLDCLINNAGIAGPTCPVEDMDLEDWEYTISVNLTGAFLAAKYSIPHITQSDIGSIINISSPTGKRPLPERTPYAASKIGMIGFTRTLAFELGEENVTVNTICPGAMNNERLRRTFQRHADQMGISYEEALAKLVTDDQAIDDIVETREVAEMAAYLASKKARHITAQDINVDAGLIWY